MAGTLAVAVRNWLWLIAPAIGAWLIALFLRLPAASIPQSAVYDACGLAMVALSLLGIRLHRPAGWQPWLLLAIGQLLFVVGDIVWTVYASLGEDPFPSAADVAYLLGYPVLALGLALAIRRRIRGGDRAGLIDGAILATGAIVLWWTFVLGPLVAASDPDPVSFGIGIAYPIGDLLLIGMALGLVMAPGARSMSYALLVANLVAVLIGDLVFGLQTADGTYVDGGLLDVAWLVAYVLFATAALNPTMAAVFDPRPIAVTLLGPIRLALLAVAMLVGPLLLAVDQAQADGFVLVVAAATAATSILVVARLAGIVGRLAQDLERRKGLEAQLSYQAFHDPLTGLANRRRLIEGVREAMGTGTGGALLFLDLDDFKDVNDMLGHDAGDALLTAVGHRIVATIRPDDLGCRIGGDEFAILLPGAGPEEAESVATRLLAAVSEPVMIEAHELTVPASIGVTVADPAEDVTVDELLRRADVAMYQAKAEGKHRLAMYDRRLDRIPGTSPMQPEGRHTRTPRAPRRRTSAATSR
jgi:diguanylate cyclase (GGDEF)-like protein